jgi:hypothetical protein
MSDLTDQITNATFVGNYENARIIVGTTASHASPIPTPHCRPRPRIRKNQIEENEKRPSETEAAFLVEKQPASWFANHPRFVIFTA